MTKSVTDDMKVLALFFLLLLPNLAFSAALVEPTAIDKQVVQLTDEETAWLKSNPELGHLALKIRSRVRMSEPEHAWTAGKPRVPVRVGDYPPFFFTDDNKPQGLAIDYVKIMCFAFDLECDYVTGMPITESFTSMREPGGIAVQPAWQRNPSREELATFTKPYFFSPFVIFQRKGDALINGMDELTGKRVVVERNYAIHKLLQRDYPDLQLVEVDFSSEALELLAAGGADAYVGNLMVGNYLSVTLGMSNIVVAAQAPYDANAMSIAVRKDRPELASLFNKGINALRPDEHAVIKGKWTFGFDSRLQESKRLISLTSEERVWLATHPKIVLSGICDLTPVFVCDGNQQIVDGLHRDYLNLIGERLHIDIEIHAYPDWKQALNSALKGETDGIGISHVVPSRQRQFNLTRPMYKSFSSIYTRADDPLTYSGLKQLEGKRVGYVASIASNLKRLEMYPGISAVPLPGYIEMVDALKRKQVDAIITQSTFDYWRARNLSFNIRYNASILESGVDIAFGLDKNEPLLRDLFNKALGTISTNERQALIDRWIARPQPGFEQRLSLSEEEQAWLSEHSSIPMCVDPNWVPFEQINQKGEYEGMVADYMALISERLGVPFKLLPTKDFSESLKKVSTGECQILSSWASVSDIEDPGLLTSSYMTASAVLAVHQDVPYILVHQDLAGLRVGAVANYPTQGKVKRLYPEAELVLVDNVDQGLQMVAAGELDAFMATQTAIVYSIQRQRLTQVKIGGVVPGEEHIGMVVNRQQPILLSILNKAVASIEPDDRRRITNKWLTVTVEREFDYSLLWKVVSGFLLILAAVLAWNYVIRRQKQALVASQARLSESEQRFRELFVYSPVAFQSLNSEGRFVDVNKPLCDLLGYDKESLLGHEFGEFWSPAIRSAYSKAFSNFKSCGETAGDLELIRSDGSIVYVHLIGRIQYDDEGRMVRTHCALHDISDRRRYEEELTKARETAEASNQAKSMFLANMSHELRTPLNAILGFSQMLGSDQSASEDQQQKLTIINRSGEHLLGMINDILDLSKIEAGEVELEQTAFNLPQVLQELGEMFEMRARSRGLLFELELNRNLASCIKADSGKLRQILINLLGNAAKFTREGGFTLRAKTTAIADDSTMVILHIEVDDSGPGIAPDQLDRIFKPFVRAEGSSASVKGTGLGLAITKSFVGLMGGEISVESTPGVGSIFRVELPVALAEAAEMAAVEIARPTVLGLEPDQPEWRILVVEDNPENRQLLVSMLHQAGFKVQEAENGKEGVSVFTQWQPHFIWMDMRMPVMDGYEATAEIRKLPGGDKVKIVAITASAFHEQHQKILDAGCDEVVHKPFKVHEVFDSMQQHLGVRYIHETEKAEPAIKLTSEMLAKLPVEQREALRQAAHDLGISATDQVIETIRSEHPEIADGLRLMADAYQFGKILALLEKEESE